MWPSAHCENPDNISPNTHKFNNSIVYRDKDAAKSRTTVARKATESDFAEELKFSASGVSPVQAVSVSEHTVVS